MRSRFFPKMVWSCSSHGPFLKEAGANSFTSPCPSPRWENICMPSICITNMKLTWNWWTFHIKLSKSVALINEKLFKWHFAYIIPSRWLFPAVSVTCKLPRWYIWCFVQWLQWNSCPVPVTYRKCWWNWRITIIFLLFLLLYTHSPTLVQTHCSLSHLETGMSLKFWPTTRRTN